LISKKIRDQQNLCF